MNYWQIASGSYGREYQDYCTRFGLAFVGGDAQIDTMEMVQPGDRVILKHGNSMIIAAGEVASRGGKHRGMGDKDWLWDFDGWELPAYCYVDWHVPSKAISQKGLTRTTICKIDKPHLRKLADNLISDFAVQQLFDPEPRRTIKVEDKEILDFLISRGLRPGAAEDVANAFNRIRLLADHYYKNCWAEDIREHETRTFLIVPFLLALGWTEHQIKIELPVGGRRRADVACFNRPYVRLKSKKTNDEDCGLIIESKGFGQGLEYVFEQAKQYADHFQNCRVIAISNGYCYKIFEKEDNKTPSFKFSAYVNIRNMRKEYPLDPDKVKGCLEALWLLLPISYI